MGTEISKISKSPLIRLSVDKVKFLTVNVTVKWAIKIEKAPNRLGTTWNVCRNHPADLLTVKTWL